MTDAQNPSDFVWEKCSNCNKPIKLMRSQDMLIYATDAIERAKAYGFHGYCQSCKRAFCSDHIAWKALMPGAIYSPYCPICDAPLGGKK